MCVVLGMFTVNTETIPNFSITEVKGLVQGNTVRTKHIGRDIGASLKSIVGGEIRGYTDMMTEARLEALNRMEADAERLGANAVVNVRFSTANLIGGGAEFLAYGTGVVVLAST